ncbi:hypothetical protein, partial [Fulvivirga aurantia]|uniref:TapB family protein n=1 Tax=Fulvivirga aurantia TaxID=2529383 RepID=UPI001629981C
MKKLILPLILLFAMPVIGWSQCNPYYDIKVGMVLETTSYNPKGKSEGKTVTTIESFDQSSNGWEAVMSIEAYDKKDKLVYEQEDVEMTCEDGVLSLNMDRFIPEETMQAFKDMNMKVEVDNIEIPDNLEVGMILDDGSVTISGDLPMT